MNLKNVLKLEILKILKENLNSNIGYIRETLSSGKIENPDELLKVLNSGEVELDYFLEHVQEIEHDNMILNLAYLAYKQNSEVILDKIRNSLNSDKFSFVYDLLSNKMFQYVNFHKLKKNVEDYNFEGLFEVKIDGKDITLEGSITYLELDNDQIFDHKIKTFKNVNFSKFDIEKEILKMSNVVNF